MKARQEKPLVVVTRKLPETVETRMRELFDARLNLDDAPMTPNSSPTPCAPPTSWCRPSPTASTRRAQPARRKLKLIAHFGNGVDNIDVNAAHALGITVTNTPKVLTEDTADMTMALILAVPRRLAEGAALLSEGKEWQGWSPTWMLGHRLGGKRLGIIGMGRIGQAVARRARAFGLQIHYHNRKPVAPSIEEELGATYWEFARPDAGAHGHHLGELPAYAGNLSPAVGAAAEAAAQGRLYRQHRARRGDRRADR